jgi:ribonuclease P protein component
MPERGKKFKITRSEEYQRCYKKGSRYSTNHFIIYVFKRAPDHQGPRLGITVTKKVGKAVVRNRIKRLIREAFRLSLTNGEKEDIDIVVMAKKGIDVKSLNLRQIQNELETIWKNAIFYQEGQKTDSFPGTYQSPL